MSQSNYNRGILGDPGTKWLDKEWVVLRSDLWHVGCDSRKDREGGLPAWIASRLHDKENYICCHCNTLAPQHIKDTAMLIGLR